jgi:hypothetical protein
MEELQTLDVTTLINRVIRINRLERKGAFPYGYGKSCPEQQELDRRRAASIARLEAAREEMARALRDEAIITLAPDGYIPRT